MARSRASPIPPPTRRLSATPTAAAAAAVPGRRFANSAWSRSARTPKSPCWSKASSTRGNRAWRRARAHHDAAGCAALPSAGTGVLVPRTLGNRTGLRRAKDASRSAAPDQAGALAERNAVGRFAGSLRVVAHGLLANLAVPAAGMYGADAGRFASVVRGAALGDESGKDG